METENKNEPETTDEREPEDPLRRFRDIIPQELIGSIKVGIVGAGGIGAPVALCLAKMGVPRIEIWDMDTVAMVNCGTQMYGERNVGQYKASALKRMIAGQAEWCTVVHHNEAFSQTTQHDNDVIISAVDSLIVRKTIWENVRKNPGVKLLVDPRMGAEVLNVFSVIPNEDSQWYEESMEGRQLEAPCTAKSTFHCGMIAGAMAAGAVKSWVVGERRVAEMTLDIRCIEMLSIDSDMRRKMPLNEQ